MNEWREREKENWKEKLFDLELDAIDLIAEGGMLLCSMLFMLFLGNNKQFLESEKVFQNF